MYHGPSKTIYHKSVARLTFLEVCYLGLNTFQANICPHYTNELVIMITRQGSCGQQALNIKLKKSYVINIDSSACCMACDLIKTKPQVF